MLHPSIPAEVLLHVFSFLPLASLAACHRVSTAWYVLLSAHSQAVFRSVFELEGFGRPSARRLEREEDDGDWRETCRQAKVLSTNWRNGRATNAWLANERRDAWRIKIDEEEGTLIMTARGGGLSVVDLHTNQQLFELFDVRPRAHLEFGHGYVVFDNADGMSHEVYRRTSDLVEGVLPAPEGGCRGHLTHFATLTNPGFIRAYRFIYPTLLIGSANGRQAWLWDVPAQRLVNEFDITIERGHSITYVELTASHIFISREACLQVFHRSSPADTTASSCKLLFSAALFGGPPRTIVAGFDLPPGKLRPEGNTPRTFGPDALGVEEKCNLAARNVEWLLEGRKSFHWFEDVIAQGYRAVHPAGPHLVLVSECGHAFVLLDYNDVLRSPEPQTEASPHLLQLNLHEPVQNLCCSSVGVVFTTTKRAFFLPIQDLPAVSDVQAFLRLGDPIRLRVLQFPDVSSFGMRECSVIQMDSTKIMLTYDVRDDGDTTIPQTAQAGASIFVKVLDFTPDDAPPPRAQEMIEARLAHAADQEDQGGARAALDRG